ncbi:MAG: hypothetical protein ACRDJN_09115, partial [Chloroflexota bacterium]
MVTPLVDVGQRIEDVMQGVGRWLERQLEEHAAGLYADCGHYSDTRKEVSFISVKRRGDPAGDPLVELVLGIQHIDGRLQFFADADEPEGAGST